MIRPVEFSLQWCTLNTIIQGKLFFEQSRGFPGLFVSTHVYSTRNVSHSLETLWSREIDFIGVQFHSNDDCFEEECN